MDRIKDLERYQGAVKFSKTVLNVRSVISLAPNHLGM